MVSEALVTPLEVTKALCLLRVLGRGLFSFALLRSVPCHWPRLRRRLQRNVELFPVVSSNCTPSQTEL